MGLKCSWQIAKSNSAPATGAAINSCKDTKLCGQNLRVGPTFTTVIIPASQIKGAFDPGNTYNMYFACFNDIPYATSISNVFSKTLKTVPRPTVDDNKQTDTKGTTSSGYSIFNY